MDETEITDDDEMRKQQQRNSINNNNNNGKQQEPQDSSRESSESAKRLKTDDSGVYVDTTSEEVRNEETSSNSASTSFPRASNSKNRNYRKSIGIRLDADDSSDEDMLEQERTTENSSPSEIAKRENKWMANLFSNSSTSIEESNHDLEESNYYDNNEINEDYIEEEEDEPDEEEEENSNNEMPENDDHESLSTLLIDSESDDSVASDTEYPAVLSKEKPKHKWFMVPELMRRELGTSAKYKNAELFQQRCYGSLHSVQRLELMYKLEKHNGCVNSLNFHPDGSLLASGSDDLKVVIWDWPVGKALLKFDSKHRGNVFQSKFLPLSGDLHIVTCSRDGQVRLHQVSRMEGVRSSRRLYVHRGATHKLALLKDQPHVVLSAGEDGCVVSHDVRTSKSVKLLQVESIDERRIPLYSINSHPLNSHEFCVSGRDHIVRIYDQRKISPVMNTFFPRHLKKKSDVIGLHVTCAMYNYNGTEILASYNDDDIYLFDTSTTNNTYVHCYQGHRNGATIKGVNFFGPKSEYIVSGSDCGNVYFWDKNTESIVQWMLADDNGVVNCLEPHPQLPIICTSGLDWDVKVWVPSNEEEPEMPNLAETVRRNHHHRQNERIQPGADINDSHMLWMIWRHLRTRERLRHRMNASATDSSNSQQTSRANESGSPLLSEENDSSSLDSSSNSDDDENLVRPISCSPS